MVKGAIYSSLIVMSLSSHAFAQDFKTSDETTAFYKSGVKSCRGYVGNDPLVDAMYVQSLNPKSSSREKVFWNKELLSMMKMIDCSPEFIKELDKKRFNENIEYFKIESKEIEAELKDFAAKGLTSGGPAKAYYDLIKKSGDDKLQLNPEIDKILAAQKDAIDSRRKTCSNKMNLKAPLSLEAPKQQDTIGWCYAFVASDLISNAIGKEVSSAYAAILYNDKILQRMIRNKESGYTSDAINEVFKNGVCLEKNLRSDDYLFSTIETDASKVYDSIIKLNEKFTEKKQAFGPDKKVERNQDLKYSKWDVQVSLCTDDIILLPGIGTMFPHLRLDQLINILMSTKPNILKQLANTCPIEDVPELKNLKVEVDTNKKTLYQTMDDQLDKGNIVGIGYKSDVLKDYKADGWVADHASSIVGRRFNEETKSCEYLLRNTWGRSCRGYSENIECKNGHAWIGENYFKYNNAITEVQYVEKK